MGRNAPLTSLVRFFGATLFGTLAIFLLFPTSTEGLVVNRMLSGILCTGIGVGAFSLLSALIILEDEHVRFAPIKYLELACILGALLSIVPVLVYKHFIPKAQPLMYLVIFIPALITIFILYKTFIKTRTGRTDTP